MTCVAPAIAELEDKSESRLHVLTLTPFFPDTPDDGQGGFVAEPLAVTEAFGVKNTVIAVRPFYRTSSPHVQGPHAKRFLCLPGNLGLSSSGRFLYSRVVSLVRAIHQREPIDVIHAHAALPSGHAAKLIGDALGIPFVVTVHGLDAFSTQQVGGYAGRWCQGVSQAVYESARRIICVSEKVRAQVLVRAPRSHTAVVYNGVDPDKFSAASSELSYPTVLSVGDLIPTKGHELLLRAFALIIPRDGTASLDIIGTGGEQRRLELLARDLNLGGKVRFLGRQSRTQVAAAMQRCALFALPSHYEALGCVYLEAMSSGQPVIGCREQGIDEVVEHGVNGFLVGGKELQGLADIIELLLSDHDLRQRIGRAARRTILSGFTVRDQASRLVEIYRECIA